MVFNECFIDDSEVDTNFELSTRKSLNLNKVKDIIIENKLTPFIIDISINGYSTNEDFDFEINSEKWSDVKHHFVKGTDAQTNPEALTVKRAIRVCSQITTNYISKKKVLTHLKAYAPLGLDDKYQHLGGVFVVPENQSKLLIHLWQNFDEVKKTRICDSVERILSYRFKTK